MLIPLLALLPALAAGSAATRAAESPGLRPLVSGPPIEVTLSLRPHNAALLARLAAASSARAPLSPRLVRQLFLPTEAELRAVRRAMAEGGLAYRSHQGLSLTFSGSPGAVAHAFGVSLVAGQRPDGSLFRRPVSQPRSPAAIAELVQDVGGLDTEAVPQPLLASSSAGVATPSCAGPAATGGYLPAQLGSIGGYGHDALIDAGFDGSGERIAFVEFSGYKPSDVAVYKSCFGLAVPVSDVPVGRTAPDRFGSEEVELDVETAIAAAPGLDHAYVYIAPQTATLPAVLNAIVADAPASGVRIVSDSWGICEPLISPARAAATNQALQLAAVSGITVLTAAGDSGSFDCSGFPVLAVDDPAAQPFATGVGGTALHLDRSGINREVVWDDVAGAGGGGLSRFWQRPAWQAGVGVANPFSNGHRELPDVALHSSPIDHGHIVYCSTHACGGRGWTTLGGTSAAAPLLAGMVADINQYSRAHGGQRLGYANPFLYDRLRHHRAVFRDVVLGDNQLGGNGRYPATTGYDMATGIGSLRAGPLAVDLANYVPSPPTPAAATLTAAPRRDRVIRYGTQVVFHGLLTDAGGAVAGEHVYLQGGDVLGIREWLRRTHADGGWSVTLSRQIVRRMTWRAVFLGSQTLAPDLTGRHTVFVIPPLTAAAGPRHRGPLVTAPGETFRFSGHTLGVLVGRTVGVEFRRTTGSVWHRIGAATVRDSGRYARLVSLLRRGSYVMRWQYRGGRHGQWMSGHSRAVAVVVR